MAAIMIKFGDNDFYTTWISVLESAVTSMSIFKIKDKDKLAFMLSHAAFGMYVLHQNQCEYNGLERCDKHYIEHMQMYLTIGAHQILLDEEVDAFLSDPENNWCNSECFYVYNYDCVPRSV